MDRFKLLSLAAIISGFVYLIWLIFHITSPIGVIFFILETGIFFLIVIFVVNHNTRRFMLFAGGYSLRNYVDVFIPTINEPDELLDQVIRAATEIEFANKRIYILDDGDRPSVKALAKKYNCSYVVRPDRKKRRFKAANMNYALSHSYGNYILVIDADQLIKPRILDDLLGHFKDDKVAFVTTRQSFDMPDEDFNHDHLFYEYMQSGKNSDDVGVSTGSAVIYSRSALTAIGGFQEWNLVEDLYTSYVFHSKGYKSIYVAQPYSIGDAPHDLSVIYKQRGTWAKDTLRLFFWKSPLFNSGLSWRQKLHYFEIGYVYIVSGLVIPLIYLVNFYSIATNDPIINVGAWYLLFKLPAFFLAIYMYTELAQGSACSRMWAALFPVFFRSMMGALLYKKDLYIPTKKGSARSIRVSMVVPQLAFIVVGCCLAIYHVLTYGVSFLLTINLFWFCIMIYWLWPVIDKGLILPKLKIYQFSKVTT